MAKKKKQPVEDHLEQPAATPPPVEVPAEGAVILKFPPPPDTDWRWPESTEHRELIVAHDDHARSEIALAMGEIQRRKEDVESEKKASNSEFKARLDDLEERMSKHAATLKAGGEKQDVRCRWVFEVSGLDSAGQWMRHPEYKCLVREDTGEVVHTVKITEADRQATLDLSGDDEGALEKALTELGWTFNERENPAEGETAFYVTNDIAAIEVNADSRLEALRGILTTLRNNEAAAKEEVKGDHFNEAYGEGSSARRAGTPRNECPHVGGDGSVLSDLRAGWLSGWNDTNDELKDAA